MFAPNSKHRAWATPAKRGKGNKAEVPEEVQTPTERHEAMSWAQRLKRVFSIDVETCSACGGAVKITEVGYASFEEAKHRITQYAIGYYSQFRPHTHNAG